MTSLLEASMKEFVMRERATNVLNILIQCHNIMDDLLGSTPNSTGEPKAIPNAKIPELQDELKGLEIYAGKLNERLIELQEKI